jgi:hypothetical protein
VSSAAPRSSLLLRICVDGVLYFLFAVVCEKVADVEALAVRLALDEYPNFNGFSSDIAVAINRYRFFDESLSMLRVDRHGLKNPVRPKGKKVTAQGCMSSLEMTFPAILR